MRQTELCVPQNHIKTTLTHHSGSTSTKENKINAGIKALDHTKTANTRSLQKCILIISHVQMRHEIIEETNVY